MALVVAPYMVSGIDFPPSQSPPGGMQPDNVPQFVMFGFDDQISPSAFRWVFEMFSGKTNPAGNGILHKNYPGKLFRAEKDGCFLTFPVSRFPAKYQLPVEPLIYFPQELWSQALNNQYKKN